jgi:hypothetical protein
MLIYVVFPSSSLLRFQREISIHVLVRINPDIVWIVSIFPHRSRIACLSEKMALAPSSVLVDKTWRVCLPRAIAWILVAAFCCSAVGGPAGSSEAISVTTSRSPKTHLIQPSYIEMVLLVYANVQSSLRLVLLVTQRTYRPVGRGELSPVR